MPAAGKKIFYALIGLLATALGVIGVWVPGLPTTVFILIALWAFSHSSTRLYNRLVNIPILGPAVKEARRFQREKTIAMGTKIVSQACAWTSFIASTLILHSVPVSLFTGLLAFTCSGFMIMLPTTQKTKADSTRSQTEPVKEQ